MRTGFRILKDMLEAENIFFCGWGWVNNAIVIRFYSSGSMSQQYLFYLTARKKNRTQYTIHSMTLALHCTKDMYFLEGVQG